MTRSSNTTIMKHVVVVGAGVIGLTSALLLAEKGYKVTILARDLPSDTGSQAFASPWAGANWCSFATTPQEEKWDTATFHKWTELNKVLPDEVMSTMEITDLSAKSDDVWFRRIMPDLRMENGALKYTSFTISVPLYTRWLVGELERLGVALVRCGTLTSLSTALTIVPSASLVVNASGLGAHTLAGDKEVHPIRGQTILMHHPLYAGLAARCVMKTGSPTLYVIPRARSGYIIFGGTFEPHNGSLAKDEALAERVMAGCLELCPELKGASVVSHNVGLRPARSGGARVEKQRIGNLDVVHAYGIGPAGYQASFGIAEDVLSLVESHYAAKL